MFWGSVEVEVICWRLYLKCLFLIFFLFRYSFLIWQRTQQDKIEIYILFNIILFILYCQNNIKRVNKMFALFANYRSLLWLHNVLEIVFFFLPLPLPFFLLCNCHFPLPCQTHWCTGSLARAVSFPHRRRAQLSLRSWNRKALSCFPSFRIVRSWVAVCPEWCIWKIQEGLRLTAYLLARPRCGFGLFRHATRKCRYQRRGCNKLADDDCGSSQDCCEKPQRHVQIKQYMRPCRWWR